MANKDVVKAIFEISKDKNVDLIVAAAMYRDENKVDISAEEKLIGEHFNKLVEMFRDGTFDEKFDETFCK